MLCVVVFWNVLFVGLFAVDADVFVAINNLQLFYFLDYFCVFWINVDDTVFRQSETIFTFQQLAKFAKLMAHKLLLTAAFPHLPTHKISVPCYLVY